MNIFSKGLSLTLVLSSTIGLSAQSLIRGVVVDQQKQALLGVNANLKHGKRALSGTATDDQGRFTLRCDKSGVCALSLSYVGYQSQTINLNLRQGEDLQLDTIVLVEASEELRGVEIVGRGRKDYNSDYSYSSTKIPIRNKDLSSAVSTVTKELIKDRQAYQLSEAIKGTSAVQQVGFYNHFNIRGITQNAHGQVVNGMRTNQIYFAQPLTQNVERIEVIKGPGSVSLSSADPGGTINIVTKKPLKETLREVGLSLGSFSTVRAGLDFTGALNESKTLLYRLNAGLQRAKSYRDLIENNSLLISPSISYLPNDRTAINLELSYTDNRGKLDRGQPTFGDTKTREDLLKTPISMSMGASTDYYHTNDFIATLSLSQKLSEGLSLNLQYLKELWSEDMKEHRTNNRYVRNKAGEEVPNLIQLRYWERNQNWNTDALNAYLTYEWQIGKVKNTTLLGYDMNLLSKPKGNGQYQARGVERDASGNIVYTTYQGIEIEKSLGGFFDLTAQRNDLKTNNNYNLTAVALPVQRFLSQAGYVQNLTKWGNLHLLLSLRAEWVDEAQNYKLSTQSRATHRVLIPRVGLSYAISKEWSAYATYLEGFQPQSQAFENMPAISNNISEQQSIHFAPLRSSLVEAGVKAELMGGRLKGTLSLFEIKQRNILMKEDDDTYSLRGSDRSRGIELELAGYLTPELQLSAAYSYLNAIITADKDPNLVGARKEAAPRHNASLWTKYSFAPSTALRGLTLGLGVQHSGERLSWWERTLMLPAYTVFDAVVSYKPVGSNMDFSLKVNNLFDTTYWTGALNKTWVFPGAPRNFVLNTTFRF